jgi:hypothetical protein
MFLNQVHYAWRELRRASPVKGILLTVSPLLVLLLLALIARALG